MNDDHDQITLGRFMVKNKTSSIQQINLRSFHSWYFEGMFPFPKGTDRFSYANLSYNSYSQPMLACFVPLLLHWL